MNSAATTQPLSSHIPLSDSQANQLLLHEAESLLTQRRLLESLTAFHRAETHGADPDRCSAGRWQAHMLLGHFEQAWQESDLIRARGTPDPHRFWQGQDFTGKHIMLRCLHGLGDAVQFLRYAPLLAERASRLTIQVPPALLELAPHFTAVRNVISWTAADSPESSQPTGRSEEPVWDIQMEINELPYIFRTRLEDLPIATNYLSLPRDLLTANRPQPRNPTCLRIGLVWSCGAWNPSRSIPFHLLRPLLDLPHCEFWNLEPAASRAHNLTHPSLHPAESCTASLLNLAALIAQLDLVITPDTLAAHLAGTLSTPAFVLLQHAADWRWLHALSNSPWYPSLRLFRQPIPNDWSSAIVHLTSELLTHRTTELLTRSSPHDFRTSTSLP